LVKHWRPCTGLAEFVRPEPIQTDDVHPPGATGLPTAWPRDDERDGFVPNVGYSCGPFYTATGSIPLPDPRSSPRRPAAREVRAVLGQSAARGRRHEQRVIALKRPEASYPGSAIWPTSQTSAQVGGGPEDSRLRPNPRSGSGDDALRAVARPRSPRNPSVDRPTRSIRGPRGAREES
jgi:hypothetical protein